MLGTRQRNHDLKRRRHAPLLALFGLFVLQLSSAVHQFEHGAGYVEAACEMCVQLDRVDDAAADHLAAAHPLPNVGDPDWLPSTGLVARVAVRDFDARAPPYL